MNETDQFMVDVTEVTLNRMETRKYGLHSYIMHVGMF